MTQGILFPGQGAQFEGMGRDFEHRQATFDAHLAALLGLWSGAETGARERKALKVLYTP